MGSHGRKGIKTGQITSVNCKTVKRMSCSTLLINQWFKPLVFLLKSIVLKLFILFNQSCYSLSFKYFTARYDFIVNNQTWGTQ